MSTFFRRTFIWRYSIIVALALYFVIYAAIIQNVPVSLTNDLESPNSAEVDSGIVGGGPTPASVAAALRAPLELRPAGKTEEVPVRPREVTTSTARKQLGGTTTTATKRPPSEREQEFDLLARNVTLNKANISDVLKLAKMAAAGDDTSDNKSIDPKSKKQAS